MLAAAEKLMRERGDDEFTLNEVGKIGAVSIGSIYCRFDGKDELIRAVQVRVMVAIEKSQNHAIDRAQGDAKNISEFVSNLVDGLAESLRHYAPILRPLMNRAGKDKIVAATGRASYMRVAERVQQAMLTYRKEIAQPDPERAVRSAYRILYASIARYLGLGTGPDVTLHEGNWIELKEDLGRMCAAFLLTKWRG